jgi:hypothetical protein
MAGKKDGGISWRQTTVLVRADLFSQAEVQGIDISDTCNRALADLLGIDYRQQKIESISGPLPVIIAKDGGAAHPEAPVAAAQKPPLPPVINADDPKAPKTIATIRKQPVKKPAPELPVEKTAVLEKNPATPAEPAKNTPAGKARKAAPKKTSAAEGLKKFIAARIVREDADDAVIAKEDLYEIFARWCREHKISQVPDVRSTTVALKNQFAFREKVVNGKPCWINVRFRK